MRRIAFFVMILAIQIALAVTAIHLVCAVYWLLSDSHPVVKAIPPAILFSVVACLAWRAAGEAVRDTDDTP